MADERHVAEGSHLIVVAEQQHEQGGLSGLVYSLGLENAQNQAAAFFGFMLISWGLMRLAKWGFGRQTIARTPPPPARVGHAVANALSKAPRAGSDRVKAKSSRHGTAGRSFAPSVADRCAWKQLRATADGQTAEWYCTRCNSACETTDALPPDVCLRDG
mgnify:CR=1 FL=1